MRGHWIPIRVQYYSTQVLMKGIHKSSHVLAVAVGDPVNTNSALEVPVSWGGGEAGRLGQPQSATFSLAIFVCLRLCEYMRVFQHFLSYPA